MISDVYCSTLRSFFCNLLWYYTFLRLLCEVRYTGHSVMIIMFINGLRFLWRCASKLDPSFTNHFSLDHRSLAASGVFLSWGYDANHKVCRRRERGQSDLTLVGGGGNGQYFIDSTHHLTAKTCVLFCTSLPAITRVTCYIYIFVNVCIFLHANLVFKRFVRLTTSFRIWKNLHLMDVANIQTVFMHLINYIFDINCHTFYKCAFKKNWMI